MYQALIGVLFIGFAPILARYSHLTALELGFWRMLFGALFLGAVLCLRTEQFAIARRSFLYLSVSALFFSLDLYFWHQSIHLIGPGLATLLANCQIVVSLVLGVCFLKEKISLKKLFVFLPLGLGLWMLLAPQLNLGKASVQGVLFGGLAALTYAGFLLCLKAASLAQPEESPALQMFVVCFCASLFLGAGVMWTQQGIPLPQGTEFHLVWVYGVVIQGVAWLLMGQGIKRIPLIMASLILLLQPLFAMVWDMLLFGRTLSLFQSLGGLFVLASLAVFMWAPRPPQMSNLPVTVKS